jgi:heterodisulfide reductase subunit A-like polyferredoxin
MANIREHCSWCHSKEKEAATQKAKDITRMSVARSAVLEPLQEFDLPVNKAALVVGGGIAGMTCALSIADQGHEVYLLEKEADLGGTARKFIPPWTDRMSRPILRIWCARSTSHPRSTSIRVRYHRGHRICG